MLRSTLLTGLRVSRPSAAVVVSRTYAGGTVSDPIQKLFLEKIREYKQKSAGGKMVDASPEIQKELQTEMEKLEKQYGGGKGIDLTQFPSFKFEDPKLDPIDEVKAEDKKAAK